MAKKFYRAEKPFTKTVNRALVVGHPKHRDPKGRVLELEESADVDRLVDSGYLKAISETDYRKEIGEGGLQEAGAARVAKTAGLQPKLSATASDLQIRTAAETLGVDLSKAKDRGDRIKRVNAKIDEQSEVEVTGADTDTRGAQTAGLTDKSTLHPVAPQTLGTVAPVADEDASPTTGKGKGGEGDEAKA